MIDEENPEWTEEMFERALSKRQLQRFDKGQIEAGEDVAAIRRYLGLTQEAFALAMGISVYTLRGWEQGQRKPNGAAIALLRIAVRHPRLIRENLPAEKRAGPAAKAA
jgi:putative transcriptional regulator